MVPSTISVSEVEALHPDGVFFSNGPGDPQAADRQVAVLRSVLAAGIPYSASASAISSSVGRSARSSWVMGIAASKPVMDLTAQGRGHRAQPWVRRRRRTWGTAPDAVRRRWVSHICLNDDVVEVCSSPTRTAGCWRSPCSTTPKQPPAPTTRPISSIGSRRSDGNHAPTHEGRVMPRRTDIESILVIGSGPIVIGQACEFDYSGTQACRVLRDEGFRVILVNSNPATIMTDPEFADATYIEPTPEFVEMVIAKEHPDALLATLGGQTALNTDRPS